MNLSGLEIVNGIGHSDTIKIDKTGDFYIRVEKEGMVANSGKITITPESPPSDTQDSNSNSDDDSGSNESSGSGDGESSSVVYPWVSFYANSYSIYPGQEATLYWETNTSRVRIEPDIGTVSATGLIKVRPQTTTIYKIYASIDNLEVSSALTVKVLSDKENRKSAEEQNGSDSSEGGRSKPIFVDVNDGKIVVKKGEKVKIYWKVDNSERVYVDYLDKDLSSEGYFEFFPQEDVKITLTASNEYGTAKKEIRVVVKNTPFSFRSFFTFRWLIVILSIFLLFFLFLFLKRKEKGNQEQRLRIKKTKN